MLSFHGNQFNISENTMRASLKDAPIAPDRAAATMSKAVVRAASFLHVSQAVLAEILGVSGATASRLVAGTYQVHPNRKKEWEFASLFVRLFGSLDAIVGHGQQAQSWLEGPNLALAGERPIEMIRTAQGLIRVLQYLDASRGRI
jgi:uncharacterized protein (DUF2384 family)